tara:strand:- start:484 stop:654 length:171 start_codon:yes stop_codon:yes gene_type:complete
MRNALQDVEVPVACDSRTLHHIQSLLRQPSGGVMTQVMKPQITETRPDKVLEKYFL